MNKIIAHILYLICKLIGFTYRFKHLNLEVVDQAKKYHPKGSYVFAIWHQGIIGGIMAYAKIPHIVMVSASKDGDLVAYALQKFGHVLVRGSSRRKGQEALNNLVELMKGGLPAAISVDGPLGPPKIVKRGVIETARLSKCCIVPVSAVPRKYWCLKKTWDQFRIPKPFSQIYLRYGKPISVPKDVDSEQFENIRLLLKQELDLNENIIVEEIIQKKITHVTA